MKKLIFVLLLILAVISFGQVAGGSKMVQINTQAITLTNSSYNTVLVTKVGDADSIVVSLVTMDSCQVDSIYLVRGVMTSGDRSAPVGFTPFTASANFTVATADIVTYQSSTTLTKLANTIITSALHGADAFKLYIVAKTSGNRPATNKMYVYLKIYKGA